MKNIYTLFVKEFRSIVFRPSFFFVLFLCSMYLGVYYSSIVLQYAALSQQLQAASGLTYAGNLVSPHVSSMNILLLFVCPFMVARLLTEEYKMNTFALLLTSPLTSAQIVIGKYLAACAAIGILIFLSLAYVLCSAWVIPFNWIEVFWAYLGVFMLASVYTAICLFAASMTSSLFVAGALSLVLCLSFWLVGAFKTGSDGSYSEFFNQLWLGTHLLAFLQGGFSILNFTVFFSFIGFFVFLTQQVIESLRWR